jgi:DNA gyrase subunit A
MGVRTIPTDKRNGPVIGLTIVHEDSHILLIDQAGKIICLSAKDIRAMGRQAKGVRLIRLDSDQKLHNVVAFEGSDDAATDNSDDETGVIIEKRTLPVTEDAGDEGDEEELEDESDEEAPEDDIKYEEEDADDVDEDEDIEL